MSKQTLKAYSVQGYENGCITFAKSNVVARREGANELDIEFEEVESCRRAPWADEYSGVKGGVPPLVMIENGWWFECCNCGHRIDSDLFDYDTDTPMEPVEENGFVYCTQACLDAENSEKAARESRKAEAVRAVEEKFPGTEVKWFGDSEPAKVSFTFPDGKCEVNWTVGEETVSVSKCDVDAWKSYIAKRDKESA